MAYFRGATFRHYADFGGVKFSREAYFRDATFIGDAYFGRASFDYGHADFSSATFGYAEFRYAKVGSTNLRNTKFEEVIGIGKLWKAFEVWECTESEALMGLIHHDMQDIKNTLHQDMRDVTKSLDEIKQILLELKIRIRRIGEAARIVGLPIKNI